MKVVIQRVNRASVTVEGDCIGKIGKGFLLLIGVGMEDTKELCDRFVDKIIKLRIFEDSEGKTNLALGDVGGEILAVSQFTLYADCRKGNRPNFIQAAKPEMANELYEYFVSECRKRGVHVETGKFGADMKVELENDGPFTVVMDESTFGL